MTKDLYWRPDSDREEWAKKVLREALAAPDVVDRMADYYRIDSNYAGSLLTDLQPNEPDAITPVDLLATSTLSVDIPVAAIRRFLDPGKSSELRVRLQVLPTDLRLEGVEEGSGVPERMAALYDHVKHMLRRANAATANPWVTASKLVARKRPLLFPVRDSVVTGVLGLSATYPEDWPTYRAMVRDAELMKRLDEVVQQAAARDGVTSLDPDLRLRHLDVVVWQWGTTRGS